MSDNPIADDHVSTQWTRNKLLGSVAYERCELLLHRGHPVGVAESIMDATRDERDARQRRCVGDADVVVGVAQIRSMHAGARVWSSELAQESGMA